MIDCCTISSSEFFFESNWTTFYSVTEELKTPSNNKELIDMVFQNEKILDCILDHVSDDAMNQLRFRIITRSFNVAILHRIRKQHVAVSIRALSPTKDELLEGADYDLMINNQRVKCSSTWNYFRFLKDVVEVKVRKLRLEDFDRIEHYGMLHSRIIHNLIGNDADIVEELIGMRDLCSEFDWCSGCQDIVNNGRCKKYGPLKLEDFTRQLHFEHLLVSDRLLFEIAKKCHILDNYRDDPFQNLEDLFETLITCDHLHVILTNTFGKPRYSEIDEEDRLSHAFPREVLDMMIVKWKVKSLKVELQDSGTSCSMWNDEMVFRKTSFEVPFHTQNPSKYFLESVEMDLECPETLCREMDALFELQKQPLLENLIANTKRLFPTNTLTVSFSLSHEKMTPESMDFFIPEFERMAKIEMARNLNLTLKLYRLPFNIVGPFRHIEVPDIFNSGAHLLPQDAQEVEDIFSLQNVVPIEKEEKRRIYGKDYTWNGMSFNLQNPIQNSNINFEILFEKKFLVGLSKVWTEVKQLGFLRHYLNFGYSTN